MALNKALYQNGHFYVLGGVYASYNVDRCLSLVHIWKTPCKADGGAMLPNPAAL